MKLSSKTKGITFVLCAAGKGERFFKHGLTKPKPLLKLNQITMLERSIQSLELETEDQLIIISQKTHNLKVSFENTINATWVEIDQTTGGQLETFLYAKDLILNDQVVIYNCDTYFESHSLREEINSAKYEGIIPCSKEKGDAWSFCQIDDKNEVLAVAEKERISEWASVGYYYFKDKTLLLKLAMDEIRETQSKESYVAPLYNKYLSRGYKLKMVPVEKFLPFGTIEQVKDYWGVSLEELIAQNK
jgi:dTDP-glucose pyrophosphorylase